MLSLYILCIFYEHFLRSIFCQCLNVYQFTLHVFIVSLVIFLFEYLSLTKFQDETGVYKNLLQEIAQRVGAPLPQYTTFRSGLGHLPVFTGTVELAGITFTGEHAKNKKQAEKNAAMAAWSSLKQCKWLPSFSM